MPVAFADPLAGSDETTFAVQVDSTVKTGLMLNVQAGPQAVSFSKVLI